MKTETIVVVAGLGIVAYMLVQAQRRQAAQTAAQIAALQGREPGYLEGLGGLLEDVGNVSRSAWNALTGAWTDDDDPEPINQSDYDYGGPEWQGPIYEAPMDDAGVS